jgi:hypothetical protein
MLVKKVIPPNYADFVYQCPVGKTAVVYVDIYVAPPSSEIEVGFYEQIDEDTAQIFTYWKGSVQFISLGPFWLDDKDKIRVENIGEGYAFCFVHGKEF